MVFSGKEGINTLVFFVFFDQMCTTLLICISNHAFLICFMYKCYIINFLLTSLDSLTRHVQRNIRPRSFVQTSTYGLGLYKKDLGLIFLCTDLALG